VWPVSSDLLRALEAISRDRPDRVVRLRGTVMLPGGSRDSLEVMLYRGFSSCTTHPTQYDPDQSVLPAGSDLETAELLQGPLNPGEEQRLLGPVPLHQLLDPKLWV